MEEGAGLGGSLGSSAPSLSGRGSSGRVAARMRGLLSPRLGRARPRARSPSQRVAVAKFVWPGLAADPRPLPPGTNGKDEQDRLPRPPPSR